MTDVNESVTPKRARRAVDTGDYLAFVRRILRALERRIGSADLEDLGAMAELRGDLDRRIEAAVRQLRHADVPASWADIGQAFGMSRQAAQQKFGHVGGARRVGGQPANLR